uniref:Uncharacterized protein n=1 Tax=Glossina palpalis gambiensis TaxID=67801 RepID=A0A1B0AT59_9MUSC
MSSDLSSRNGTIRKYIFGRFHKFFSVIIDTYRFGCFQYVPQMQKERKLKFEKLYQQRTGGNSRELMVLIVNEKRIVDLQIMPYINRVIFILFISTLLQIYENIISF